MEAKDTVIRYQKKHPVVAGSAEWHMIDGYNLGAEAQAEISFKMGYNQARAETLKEVGEYIDQQHDILAEDLGYRLAFLDGLAEDFKSGTMPDKD